MRGLLLLLHLLHHGSHNGLHPRHLIADLPDVLGVRTSSDRRHLVAQGRLQVGDGEVIVRMLIHD